ncbi:origin recognition complex, subunit 6 [Phialemonium atrogriseum]|uniref:Origin recognition complex, subunit 6 n=1 Tax=Phialemonium atrogriseum TaxID=1093897 RepID=A0AAJ0C938_9PEZI|nr:origin recognition complex, subunit 6 [Phialemonium atrogriseum]KAK1772430.1 origin recognition complex, subunit 6 [Phialemonium atrogriseum]
MNRSIEQTLLSLLPTHNAELPQPLVDLAGSLLAQSRHRASTLKSDEEIARPYACAHLACDRLKISLNLPPIHPRPPVPPRIYKRLYNHLDNILPSSSTGVRSTSGRVRTPSAKLRESGISPGGSSLPSRATPNKDQSLAASRSPSTNKTGTPSKLGRPIGSVPHKRSTTGLPPWIRPSLGFLCKVLDDSKIGRTVVAGMESIVMPHGRTTSDEWVMGNLSSLLGSLYLYIWGSVSMPEGVDEARYVHVRKEIVETLNKARRTISIKGVDEGDAWEGWKEIHAADIDNAALRINRHGWLESDWAKSIEDLIQKDREDESGGEGNDDADNTQSGPAKRADIMFQDRYDFLSEHKRKEYAIWKDGIIGRIQDLERGADAMEVDS